MKPERPSYCMLFWLCDELHAWFMPPNTHICQWEGRGVVGDSHLLGDQLKAWWQTCLFLRFHLHLSTSAAFWEPAALGLQAVSQALCFPGAGPG